MKQPAPYLLAQLGAELPELCAGLLRIVTVTKERDPATGLRRPVDPYTLDYLASDLLRIACASRDRVAAAAGRLGAHGEGPGDPVPPGAWSSTARRWRSCAPPCRMPSASAPATSTPYPSTCCAPCWGSNP